MIMAHQIPSVNQLFEVGSLSGSHVKMKDVQHVKEKITKLVQGGKQRLQIISDFDRTLSRHHYQGQMTKSSFGVFECIPTLSKEFVDETRRLYTRFRVVEDDPSMTVEEKIPHMEEWWRLSNDLFVGLPFDMVAIRQAVVDSQVKLRVGVDVAMEVMRDNGIPVLVFSAGLGDIVTSIIEHYNLMFNNVHVISNFFKHDNNIITGFKGNTIHIFNKNEHAIENSQYFQDVKERHNVILMGDSLGDSNMSEGVRSDGVVLKIGFLSVKVEEYLDQYLNHFDIVLIDDSTMDVFNDILNLIINC